MMKLAVLLLGLVASASGDRLEMSCKAITGTGDGFVVEGEDCNSIRQRTTCNPEKTNIVTVRWVGEICDKTGIILPLMPEEFNSDGEERGTYIIIRGPAYKSENESTAGTLMNWKSIGASAFGTQGGTCVARALEFDVDICKNHFNINFYSETHGEGTEPVAKHIYDTYMRRNCPLYTEISCKDAEGVPCDVVETCAAGDMFTYTFCYETTFEKHNILLRENFPGCTTGEPECIESHLYLGGRPGVGTFVGSAITEAIKIGYSAPEPICFEHTASSCVDGVIDSAYMNVVGSVRNVFDAEGNRIFPYALDKGEWKACFSSFFLPMSNSNSGNPPETGGPEDPEDPDKPDDGEPCPPSVAPSASPSLTPTKGKGKGTKKPKKCKGKGTKKPSEPKRARKIRDRR